MKGIKEISPQNTCPLKAGVVLLGIGPDTFGHVSLVASNEIRGSIGFVLNEQLNFPLPQIVDDLGGEGEDIPVYKGGGDNPNLLHVLHTGQYGGQHIGPSIHWGGDYKPIMEGIKEHQIESKEMKFLIGNQNWAGGELESLIEGGKYVCLEPSPASILTHKNTFKYFLRKTGMFGLILLMEQGINVKEN